MSYLVLYCVCIVIWWDNPSQIFVFFCLSMIGIDANFRLISAAVTTWTAINKKNHASVHCDEEQYSQHPIHGGNINRKLTKHAQCSTFQERWITGSHTVTTKKAFCGAHPWLWNNLMCLRLHGIETLPHIVILLRRLGSAAPRKEF